MQNTKTLYRILDSKTTIINQIRSLVCPHREFYLFRVARFLICIRCFVYRPVYLVALWNWYCLPRSTLISIDSKRKGSIILF